jgi:hypothetical protein
MRFAGLVLDASRTDLCDVGADDVQEWATQCGFLAAVTVTEPCSEECRCAEYDSFPQPCLRYTAAGRACVDAAYADDAAAAREKP